MRAASSLVGSTWSRVALSFRAPLLQSAASSALTSEFKLALVDSSSATARFDPVL